MSLSEVKPPTHIIRRDDTGKRTLVRETLHFSAIRGCTKCKCQPLGTRRKLYRYWWEHDGMTRRQCEREERFALPFCSIKHFDAYYRE